MHLGIVHLMGLSKPVAVLNQVTIRVNGNAPIVRRCTLRDCSSILAKKDLVGGNLGMENGKSNDAIKILKSGRLREGMEILENLVANDPDNVDVLYNLGMCYSELGSIGESIEKSLSAASNEWAKILKVSEWFAWVGFEDVPESYFADV